MEEKNYSRLNDEITPYEIISGILALSTMRKSFDENILYELLQKKLGSKYYGKSEVSELLTIISAWTGQVYQNTSELHTNFYRFGNSEMRKLVKERIPIKQRKALEELAKEFDDMHKTKKVA